MKKFRHLYLIVVAILMCASVSIPLLFNLAPSRNDADYFYNWLSGQFSEKELDSLQGRLKDDFDERIISYLVDEFKKSNGIDLKTDKMAMQRLK